jgi:hypothetical protein
MKKVCKKYKSFEIRNQDGVRNRFTKNSKKIENKKLNMIAQEFLTSFSNIEQRLITELQVYDSRIGIKKVSLNGLNDRLFCNEQFRVERNLFL